jgi:acetyltransferase-like isoleucine patch superfamily enzyme
LLIKGIFMKLLIYGNGPKAKLLYAYAKRSMDVCGFTVDDHCILPGESLFCGLPLVPFSEVEQIFPPDSCEMIVAIGYEQMNGLRQQKIAEAAAKGYPFTSFVHETLIRHEEMLIGDNCIILDHVSIHPGTRIEHGSFIDSNVNIGQNCHIKAMNWISAGVSVGQDTVLGTNCFVGANASIEAGIEVSERTYIAANLALGWNTEPDDVFTSNIGEKSDMKSPVFLLRNCAIA